MKNQKNLRRNLITHILILIAAIAFALAYHLSTNDGFDTTAFIGLSCIVFFDFEVAFFIIHWFKNLNKKYAKKYVETSSVIKVVWINLLGLLFFFVIFILANTFGTIVFVIVLHQINGWEFPDILNIAIDGGVIKATAIAMLYSTPVFLFLKWLEAIKKEFKMKEQNLIFQNETLKNQVNPHFLFNSLNTLSSLVNSEVAVAGQFIAKLSVIYRYILDNSSKLLVPLEEEIEFIKDYYYLHQIRNEGKIKLEIDINNDGYSYKIIPISLQLLIENAIKHNMATLDKPLIINVYLEGQNIVVKNNIQKLATQVVSTKIGLKNLSERVRLVTGYEVVVSEIDGNFLVKVPLIE
jgi:sensor histidine kinase YesM